LGLYRWDLLHEQFEAFEITLLSPFRAGVNPALVDQDVDRVEPGNFALEFIVMSLHQLIQFVDRDTFGMLTHQAENQLDGTILLGEFSTVRHDCSFLPPFFLALLAMGDTWPEALSGEIGGGEQTDRWNRPSDFEQLTTRQ
jgi:hypothetical protein